MMARVSGPYGSLICECGYVMEYLADVENNVSAPRTVRCSNPRCRHFQKEFLEPLFELVLVAKSAIPA